MHFEADPDGLASIRVCLGYLAEDLACHASFLLLREGTNASILASYGLSPEAANAYTTGWHRLDP